MNQVKNLEQTETVLRAGISAANNIAPHKALLAIAKKLSKLGFDDDSHVIKKCLSNEDYDYIFNYLNQSLDGVKNTLSLLTNGHTHVFISFLK